MSIVPHSHGLAQRMVGATVRAFFPDLPSTNEAVSEWLDEVRQNNRPATYVGYRSFAAAFERSFPFIPVEPAQIGDWISEQGAPGSKTRDNAWRRASVFFSWLERTYGVPHPMEKLRKPRIRQAEPRWFSIDELRAIDAAVDDDFERGMLAAYLGIALRLSEGGALVVGDIRADRLEVREGKERSEYVPLTDDIRDDLLRLTIGRGDNSPVFGVSNDTVARRLKALYSRAGIQLGSKERIGAHVLRHSFMSAWQESGGNPLMADRILRHSNRGMAHHYTHFTFSQLRDGLAQYGPLSVIRSDTTPGCAASGSGSSAQRKVEAARGGDLAARIAEKTMELASAIAEQVKAMVMEQVAAEMGPAAASVARSALAGSRRTSRRSARTSRGSDDDGGGDSDDDLVSLRRGARRWYAVPMGGDGDGGSILRLLSVCGGQFRARPGAGLCLSHEVAGGGPEPEPLRIGAGCPLRAILPNRPPLNTRGPSAKSRKPEIGVRVGGAR